MSLDPIRSVTLRDGAVSVTLLSVGCAVQDWQVGGRRVVLGYGEAEAYRANPVSMGVVCGRVVNRIAGARFALDGQGWLLDANDGPNHLHGGPRGFGWRNWRVEVLSDRAARFSLQSPHLDGGYPGAVEASVTVSLDGLRLTWEMAATADRPTPINLAQHVYFHLGMEDIRDARLRIDADACLPTGPDLLPLGHEAPVTGALDFRDLRPIGRERSEGYDLSYVLNPGDGAKAEVQGNDLRLRLWTDQVALQLYTSNTLGEAAVPLPGQAHHPFGAICLEAQGYPNAVNQPDFPSTICTPDRPYAQRTSIEVAPL